MLGNPDVHLRELQVVSNSSDTPVHSSEDERGAGSGTLAAYITCLQHTDLEQREASGM